MKQTMGILVLVLCLATLCFCDTNHNLDFVKVSIPKNADVVFGEVFDNHWKDRWTVSTKEDFQGEWRVEEGQPPYHFAGDKGLVVGSAARKHAISTRFEKAADISDKQELVVQYEVRLQKSLDCGGAYMKLLTASSMPSDLDEFSNETPYTIMFGPDKCGENDKVHFIIRHQNPVSKTYEEKHYVSPPKIKRDSLTHLYSLRIRNDDTFTISIDNEVVSSGDLMRDFSPAFAPPKEVDDPSDKKPADWVDSEDMVDPEARKPDDWDEDAPAIIPDPDDVKPETWLDNEPEEIPNPDASKPEDWDDELDGVWQAPPVANPKCAKYGCGVWKQKTITNPAFKGKWKAPMIPNPDYKGEWKPRQIPNPNYFEIESTRKLDPIGGLGIEIWTMTDNILFDNFLVTYSKAEADKFASQTWVKKNAEETRIKQEEDAKNTPGILEQVQTTIDRAVFHVKTFVSDPSNLNIVIAMLAVGILLLVSLCVCVFCSGRDEVVPPAAAAPVKADKAEKAKTTKRRKEDDESKTSDTKEKTE